MTSALLVRNPIARHRLSDAQLAGVTVTAGAAGWNLEVVSTDRAGAATTVARDAAARGIDVLIVHGGDGTVNEAINGLAHTNTALAVLRGGTANVWAKEIGVSKDPVKAMHMIVTGERRTVDLGRANDRHFLLMCGIGLDARIVDSVGVRMKRRFGAAAYVVAGVATALTTKPWSVDLSLEQQDSPTSPNSPSPRMWRGGRGVRSNLYWMLAGNTRSYGGMVQLTHRALIDDGALDVALMRKGNALRLLRDGALALFKRHERSPNIAYTRTRAIEITTPGIPIQLDGEACGETPVRIDCAPAALQVIVPRGLRSPLWS